MTKKDYFHTELYDLMVFLAYSGVSYDSTTGEYSATQLAEYVADDTTIPNGWTTTATLFGMRRPTLRTI